MVYLSKGLEGALLLSKFPSWFGLYSNAKFFSLAAIVLYILLHIKYLHKYFCSKFILTLPQRFNINSLLILLILSIISNYLLNRNGITVGEDVCGQVLSSIQFLKGETHLPNYTSFPDSNDLSINNISWSPRPPAGSWVAVPGLLIGLSLGKAINFMLLLLYITGCSGLLLTARKLKLPYDSEILFAVFLGLSAGEVSGLFFSMNCALFSVIPFLILYTLKYKDFLFGNNSIIKIIVFSIFLGLCLGSLAFIKLSGMIAAYSITAIPIIYILIVCILKRKIRKRNILGVSLLIVFTTFPFKTIEFINESIRGKSANLMYSSVDYNSQYDLWGNYFKESTQGKMLSSAHLGDLVILHK